MKKHECCYLHKAIFTFEKGIRDYIALKVSDKADAADIAQEVFLKVSLAHGRDEKIDNVKSWIYTLTNNTIAEYYRRKYRKREIPEEISSSLPDPADQPSELCACDFINPLISLLEEKYRIPLTMSDLNNIPQGSIATHLSLSLPATKSRIQRARKKLRELFIECTHVEYDKYGNVFSFEIKESCIPVRDARNKIMNS